MARKLPRWMHEKHGAFYIVRNNKWQRLGATLHESLVEYAKLISQPSNGEFSKLTERVLDFLKPDISASTFKHYAICKRRVDEAFQEFSPDQILAVHVQECLDDYRHTPAMANMMRAFLKNVFRLGVKWGLVKFSPMADVEKCKVKARDRYLTQDEYQAIKDNATPTLSALMDIAYMTGQRIGDCLNIQYADISKDGIYFCQQKTKNKVFVTMTPDLSEAVSIAKGLHKSLKGFSLFHRGDGAPIPYTTIHRHWVQACEKAGVKNARFHDIRAAAATDAKATGLDSKTLLGHSSEIVHNKYLRSKEVPVATPNRARKSKNIV